MASATYLAPGVYVEEVPSAQQPIAGVGTNVVGFIGIVPPTIYIPVPNPDYDPVAARAAAELADLASRPAAGPGVPAVTPEAKARLLEEAERAVAELENSVESIKTQLTALQEKLADATRDATATKTTLDTANTALEGATAALSTASEADRPARTAELETARTAAAGADRANTTASRKVDRLQDSIRDKQSELDDLTTRLDAAKTAVKEFAAEGGGAGAGGAGAGAGAGDGAGGGAGGAGGGVEKEDVSYTDVVRDSALLARSILRPFILKEFVVNAECFDTKLCTNFTEYTQRFGTFSAYKADPDVPYDNPDRWTFSPMHPGHHALTHAVNGFFRNGGTKAFVARITSAEQLEDALEKFRSIDELAIIAAPGLPKTPDVWEDLMDHVENRENCFAILDSPLVVNDGDDNDLDVTQLSYSGGGLSESLPRPCKNAGFYFPHIEVIDPAKQLQDSDPLRKVNPRYRGRTYVPPSGHVAGIYARTDVERGVHKAPANCVVRGAIEVKYYVSKPVQELLNPQGVNAIRIMNGAVTVWGARTIGGDANSEWKYVSVRRLFLFLQKSIEDGTQWIVFEPNDEALWAKIRLNVSAFLTNVWRSGALFGSTPEEAFYVKCDAELNPPEVRDVGQVITEIGVAIVRPAEFVIFRITQSTGAPQT